MAEAVYSLYPGKVGLGDAAGIVCGDGKFYPVVDIGDAGMVVELLGDEAYADDEAQPLAEAGKAVGAYQFAVGKDPAGEGLQADGDFGVGERKAGGHIENGGLGANFRAEDEAIPKILWPGFQPRAGCGPS